MKTITLSAIAASIALAMPALAEDAHHPAQPGGTPTTQAQPDGKTVQKMQGNLSVMQKQLERLGKAKTAEERQKLMDDHMKTMQENMGMTKGMQSGMMDCPMMQGGMGMKGQGKVSPDDMMSKRMEMMEKRMDMMQMMMQGRMGMPSAEPAKPAN
jgi:hypothetical protein